MDTTMRERSERHLFAEYVVLHKNKTQLEDMGLYIK